MTTSRVRHIIEITDDCGETLVYDFQSRDIGCTQGSTLWHGPTLLGHYRPGTRYWDVAFEVAERLLVEATTVPSGGMQAFIGRFTAALKNQSCRPWDGNDPDWGGSLCT